MKIIIPMAGIGKRMRPHTLTVPKPLISVAGKPIVQWLIEEIAKVSPQKIEEIAFILGHFGDEVEKNLKNIASTFGAKSSIYYQDEALGTGHAIYCAEPSLSGNIIVAFADTLFKADFILDNSEDGSIWVKKVTDPSSFGVVKIDSDNKISSFIEKPKTFVSDLAIIGIYYFKKGEILREELKKLIDNKVIVNGEYQLTDALETMKSKGLKFAAPFVSEWLDCGNKNATVYANQRILENHKDEKLISTKSQILNSVIIPPCFIDDNVKIENSVIGPHSSIGKGTEINYSIVKNSIIQQNSIIKNAIIDNSMIGNFVKFEGKASDLNIGDFCTGLL
ncbi:MAG: sugar phosphate nucleotidyltransferase [Bacteroidota bacterium]